MTSASNQTIRLKGLRNFKSNTRNGTIEENKKNSGNGVNLLILTPKDDQVFAFIIVNIDRIILSI